MSLKYENYLAAHGTLPSRISCETFQSLHPDLNCFESRAAVNPQAFCVLTATIPARHTPSLAGST